MTKKRLKISLFGMATILFILWLIGFLVFMSMTLSTDPISFSISLNNKTIERGDLLYLEYKISNLWIKKIDDLNVDIKIIDKPYLQENFSYNHLNIFEEINGNYSLIPINSHLSTGEYVIDANLTYLDDKGITKSKWLTLQFEVT